MDLQEIRKKLKKDLDKARYEHTKGVMYTAACLAMAYGYPVEKAMLAGLLHDCAKCLPTEEKQKLCEEHHILVSEVELENPGLLHAKAGMALAEEKYDVQDPEILLFWRRRNMAYLIRRFCMQSKCIPPVSPIWDCWIRLSILQTTSSRDEIRHLVWNIYVSWLFRI